MSKAVKASASGNNIYLDVAKRLAQNSVSVKQDVADNTELLSTTVEVAKVLCKAFRSGNKLLLFGNGGSAADAQHIAAEFVGRYKRERLPLPALALTVNTSCLTAIANDYAFESVFSRQVDAIGAPGDVAIGISTSGNSKNVLQGLDAAKRKRMITIGFTGAAGRQMESTVDYCLMIPSRETPNIQECHITLGHIICEIVEEELFHE